jgi:hypothetical protein
VNVDVMAARSDWEQGYARLLDEARDPVHAERLHAQLEVVTAALRRRVGGMFTLRELAEAYVNSESWAHEAVANHAPFPGWPRTLAVVGDAAFYIYARGAVDYTP